MLYQPKGHWHQFRNLDLHWFWVIYVIFIIIYIKLTYSDIRCHTHNSSWLSQLPDSQADLRFWVTGRMQGPGAYQTGPVDNSVQTQPTKHKLRGAQLWGGQSPAKTFKNDFGWSCLECDDFLQLCQVDSNFPNIISFIIWTKCLLSNVSNDIIRSSVLISNCFTNYQMFWSAYRSGRVHVCQFCHRKNKTKWGHPTNGASYKSLVYFSFPLLSVEKCDHWRLDLRYHISHILPHGGCQANLIYSSNNI